MHAEGAAGLVNFDIMPGEKIFHQFADALFPVYSEVFFGFFDQVIAVCWKCLP